MTKLVDLVFTELNEDFSVKKVHKITCDERNWLALKKDNGCYMLQIGTPDDIVLTFKNTTFPNIVE